MYVSIIIISISVVSLIFKYNFKTQVEEIEWQKIEGHEMCVYDSLQIYIKYIPAYKQIII